MVNGGSRHVTSDTFKDESGSLPAPLLPRLPTSHLPLPTFKVGGGGWEEALCQLLRSRAFHFYSYFYDPYPAKN